MRPTANRAITKGHQYSKHHVQGDRANRNEAYICTQVEDADSHAYISMIKGQLRLLVLERGYWIHTHGTACRCVTAPHCYAKQEQTTDDERCRTQTVLGLARR